MITPTRARPTPTKRQMEFLDVLSDGKLTGRQMRIRLLVRREYQSRRPFFRVMQRLKRAGLVKSERISRDEGEYPGAQGIYELTELGKDALRKRDGSREGDVGAQREEECRQQMEMARLCLQ